MQCRCAPLRIRCLPCTSIRRWARVSFKRFSADRCIQHQRGVADLRNVSKMSPTGVDLRQVAACRQAAPPAMRTAFMRMVQFSNSVACMRFGAQREEPRAVWAIPTDLGCPSVNGPHQATRRDAKRRRRAPGRDSGLGRLNNGWRAHSVRQLKTMLALPKLSFKPPIDADSVAPLNAPAVHLG